MRFILYKMTTLKKSKDQINNNINNLNLDEYDSAEDEDYIYEEDSDSGDISDSSESDSSNCRDSCYSSESDSDDADDECSEECKNRQKQNNNNSTIRTNLQKFPIL